MEHLEDIAVLKQFVKKYPDNQMGWYLLGKQYMQAGKVAKANYCFLQSGNIYEAYEQHSHPLVAHQMEAIEAYSDRHHSRQKKGRYVLFSAVMLLFALLVPLSSVLAPGTSQKVYRTVETFQPLDLYVAIADQGAIRPLDNVWSQLIGRLPSNGEKVAALQLPEQQGWRDWAGDGARLLMSLEREAEDDELALRLYDPVSCQCKPSDASNYQQLLKDWRHGQEQHWTLASAIVHFERMYGQWPKSVSDLVRDFPRNVLAGDSAIMRRDFAKVSASLQAQRKANEKGERESNDSSSPLASATGSNGLLDEQWFKPIEIVVDKSTYQLILVQGDIVIRQYQVGLGGDKTPEGTFEVTEKVREPNGRRDGPFGSRGMELSSSLYAIHGTEDPSSIGKDESLGCIRMHEQDLQELYDLTPLGTTVKIKNGILPSFDNAPSQVFQLEPGADETNPAKVYKWL